VPTFDVHQHLWPDEVVEVLRGRKEPPYLRGRELVVPGEGSSEVDLGEHDLERRLTRLDSHGTDVAVISLQPTLGWASLPELERAELLSAWHEGAPRLAAEAQGRLRVLAAAAPVDGFAGACVSAGDMLRGGSEFDTLAGELAERSCPLFVHPGPGGPADDAPDWWAGAIDYPAQMQQAYFAWVGHRDRVEPRPRTIFALLAGCAPSQFERFVSRGGNEASTRDESVYFEISSYGPRAVELCMSTVGAGQLLFGSDFPVMDPQETLAVASSFGDALLASLREETPGSLFG
jgi:6-methylsalicylate decarboxylase